MKHFNRTPSFAIVGRSNEGKTSLMATFTEKDYLKISATPGSTRKAMRHSLEVDEHVIHFWDTPGFQNIAETHAWFQSLDENSENPAAEFISQFENLTEFQNECEIFKPLAEGAVMIYLVDTSNRVRKSDRQQLEVLRRCGNTRIGIIYTKTGDGAYQNDWKKLLRQEVNTWEVFNSHTAGFAKRMALLDLINNVNPDWNESIDNSINALKSQWEAKKKDAVKALINLLEQTLQLKETLPLCDETDQKTSAVNVDKKLRKSILKCEKKFRGKIRKIFNHSTNHWEVAPSLTVDISTHKVWKTSAWSKLKIIAVGTIPGVIAGGVLDIAAGGATLFLGSVIGAFTSFIFAWAAANTIAKFATKYIKNCSMGTTSIQANVNPQSNFIYILIERGLRYIELVSQLPHGNTDKSKSLVIIDGDNLSLVKKWSVDETKSKVILDLTNKLSVNKQSRNTPQFEKSQQSVTSQLLTEINQRIR